MMTNCTNYNEFTGYNAALAYDGVCVSNCTLYDNIIGYDANIAYDGICVSDCTLYNDEIGYDTTIAYNGDCASPPPAPSIIAGGFVRHDYHRELPKKKQEDDFGLILSIFEMLDDDY